MNPAIFFRRMGAFRLLLLVSLLTHGGLSWLVLRLLYEPKPQQQEAAAVVMVNLASRPATPHVAGNKPPLAGAQPPAVSTQQVSVEQPVRLQPVPATQPSAPATGPAPSAPAASPRSGQVTEQTGSPALKADQGEPRTNTIAGTIQAPAAGRGTQDAIFGTVAGPAFQRRVDPVYPSLARRRGKEGTVLLQLTISETGQLSRVDIMTDPGYGLAEAAVEAIRASTFTPARHHGKAVASRATLPVRFTLH